MKLSIIVPVYNLEKYIARTLDSLLHINFSFEYEIITINDGSTDSSGAILNKYSKIYDSINVVSIPNGGVSNARNIGIKKSKGEYVTFIDGDDTVEPDFFEKAVRELDKEGYDFVQGNHVVIENEKVFYNQHVYEDKEVSNYQEMLYLFFRPGQEKKIHNNVWGKVFRAEVVRRIAFDCSLIVAEDQKYVFDVLRIAKKIKLMKDNCIFYYQRESSAMHIFSVAKEQGKLEVLDYCESNISNCEIISFINWHRIKTFIGLYWFYTKQRDSLSEEVRNRILKIYSKDIVPFFNKKINLILIMLRYTPSILDLYIRRK